MATQKNSKNKKESKSDNSNDNDEILVDLDDLLFILGNPHRREIIKLLSMEDRYAFELARLLNISQRAVTKHLESLSKLRLIRSRWVKSNQGPQRQYYTLEGGWVLSLSIGPNVFHGFLKELSPELSDDEINQFLKDIWRGETIETLRSTLHEIRDINQKLAFIEEEKIKYLKRKTGILEALELGLEKLGFNEKEKAILRVLIEKNGQIYLTELSEILKDDIQDLKDAIEHIREKEIISITPLGPTEALIKLQHI